MYEIRRKLRSQRGVTMVFALVIFLIMALFSYVMVNASLTAVQGANASRVDEQAALSVASASRVLQRAIQLELPNVKYTTSWTSDNGALPSEGTLRRYIVDALNGTSTDNLLLNVSPASGDNTDVTDKIGKVTVSISAENGNVTGPDWPRLILNFSKDGAYYSNTVITLHCVSDNAENPSYTVSFLDTLSTLGQYQAS